MFLDLFGGLDEQVGIDCGSLGEREETLSVYNDSNSEKMDFWLHPNSK